MLLIDTPVGVERDAFLRSLFGNEPNVPGEAEALPGDADMLHMKHLQPHFPPEMLLNEIAVGRAIYSRVFIQHFKNGQGGFEQASPDLTESDFIECCAYWHTRQFAKDIEFCAFAYSINVL